jgi:hypothetical protein
VIVQSVEIAVFVPLLLLLAARWGATGAAAAMLASTVVFCGVWTFVILRIQAEHRQAQVVAP